MRITISQDRIAADWAVDGSGTVAIDPTGRSAATFVHKIGHALGLAHAGNYNFTVDYESDSVFANDSTQASIMSYFDSCDNPTTGASDFTSITPMIADIIAVQNLYGTNVSTRGGNTIYGNGSTTGTSLDLIADTFAGGRIGVTVFDSGGTDTFDFSNSGENQRLDISSEGISDVHGATGNLIVARNTVIENIMTGGSNDNVTGNSSSNQISAGAGSDFILPGSGSDTVDGGQCIDMVSFSDLTRAVRVDLNEGKATSGDDTTTLINIENITGSIYGDYIIGDEDANRLRGLGNYDWIVGSDGNDQIDGGSGRDMISYVSTAEPVTVNLAEGTAQTSVNGGFVDRLTNIERVTGSMHSDLMYGSDGQDDFRGLGGYDWFVGVTGGSDRYDGGNGNDTVSYALSTSGVIASISLGRGSGGDAARNLYKSIESLTGSSFDDTLTGDNGRNVLRGQFGEDSLYGQSGGVKLKWSGKIGPRAKVYPTRMNGYENDETTEFFRQV